MISVQRLWAAQQAQWPNSVRLLPQQLLMWAHTAPNSDQRFQRMATIATTTQFNRVLFYITDPECGYIGARYGVEPHESFSNFSAFRSRLDEGGHVQDTEYV